MTAATLTLTDFLLARIAEDEAAALGASHHSHLVRDYERDNYGFLWVKTTRVLAECEAKRRVVELHKSWPVLVEQPIEVDLATPNDPASFALRASKRLQWLTEQQYRERFGDEPPTAPMLAALAAVYADHPDYRDEWRP